MFKAIFIGAILGLIYVTSFNIISPVCTLCVTPLIGLGVGYLTSWFEQPDIAPRSFQRGVFAGSITAMLMIPGQIVATLTNAIILTNLENWSNYANNLGLVNAPLSNEDYWQTTLITNTMCGGFNIVVIVSFAAVGSMLWFQQSKSQL